MTKSKQQRSLMFSTARHRFQLRFTVLHCFLSLLSVPVLLLAIPLHSVLIRVVLHRYLLLLVSVCCHTSFINFSASGLVDYLCAEVLFSGNRRSMLLIIQYCFSPFSAIPYLSLPFNTIFYHPLLLSNALHLPASICIVLHRWQWLHIADSCCSIFIIFHGQWLSLFFCLLFHFSGNRLLFLSSVIPCRLSDPSIFHRSTLFFIIQNGFPPVATVLHCTLPLLIGLHWYASRPLRSSLIIVAHASGCKSVRTVTYLFMIEPVVDWLWLFVPSSWHFSLLWAIKLLCCQSFHKDLHRSSLFLIGLH